MNSLTRLCTIFNFFCMLFCLSGCAKETAPKSPTEPMKVSIIVGSVRSTPTGMQIAQNIKAMADKRPEIKTEIIEIASYNLPFYTDEVSPASRKGAITDPTLRTWSEAINQAQGYIIIAPEYNSGYPGALKNALDSLYVEWNNKPVAFIGYSGGPSGGAAMIAQLRQVVQGLQMIPVAADIKIPESWKAFTEHGELVDVKRIEKELNTIIDQLLQDMAS